jgi:hypothetical protein
MVLIYLDPTSFELYFKTVIQKISTKLNEIVKKEHKLLTSFLSCWTSTEKDSIFLYMQKEEKYWYFRQSKKSLTENE